MEVNNEMKHKTATTSPWLCCRLDISGFDILINSDRAINTIIQQDRINARLITTALSRPQQISAINPLRGLNIITKANMAYGRGSYYNKIAF